MTVMEQEQWLDALASNAPAPGGGGASAVVGSIAYALGSMVANLTIGKKKYAEYEEELKQTLRRTEALRKTLYDLMEADAKAFEPLAAAYGIPKEDPNRDAVLENALYVASEPPMRILEELSALPPLLETLCEKGSRLALSDVGCAASFGISALEGAWINLCVNTRLYKDREKAKECNRKARMMKEESVAALQKIVQTVEEFLLAEK